MGLQVWLGLDLERPRGPSLNSTGSDAPVVTGVWPKSPVRGPSTPGLPSESQGVG